MAFVALASLAAAGCSSDVSRLGDIPTFTGSTANQRTILSGQPAPAGQGDTTGSIGGGTAPVQQTMLPPPTAPAYTPPPAPTYQPPRAAAVQPTVGSPNGWTGSGSTVTLQSGETVDTLSRRYGVPAAAILSANNIADPSRVYPGQQIVIPTYNAAAAAQPPVANVLKPPAVTATVPAPAVKGKLAAPPVATAPAAQPAPFAAASAPHVVRPGDTLDRIAASYGTTKAKLMQANSLKSDAIRPGQRITVPAGAPTRVAAVQPTVAAQPGTPARPATPVAQAPAPAGVAPQPQVVAKAPEPVKAPPASSYAPAKLDQTASISKAEPEAMVGNLTKTGSDDEAARGSAKSGQPSFRWPVRGRVIKEFGTANGERNDGINLAVPEGTSIKAAEDGEVIYSGNELKGYGNLVLVRHSDGWVTAYAHASELLVARGEKITRGQIIARAGATGGVSQPQLHFEIRKGQRPVDPKQLLANN
ncbi:peptidoglycan DD-metalloendopeptidase family protein [Prosthecomicrobium sp. N25]|uniref:peptidoglycan DD-metalloendopeptidase family protein n=1 Tax=Prosthecomicrobium sp. N25 TaxID=3129254 RepID=UPI0030781393